ncbi:MAG: efflux transporter outer membrane subunit [Methylotetracoccus sp.]
MDRRKTEQALLLALSLAASGCAMVGPDFAQPDAATASNWLETSDKKLSRRADDHREWWRVFKDPALDHLIETAYRQNLSLQIAGVRILEARAQIGVAVGDLYPQDQHASALIEKFHLPLRGLSERLPSNEFVNTLWLDRIGLSASWELDLWGKFRRAIESADADLLAAIADYDTILVSLTADVADAYIRVRTLEKKIDIAHDNVTAQQGNLEIADAKFKGGSASQRDVEQALTVLASTRATIPKLESQLRQTKNALCLLLGMPPTSLDKPLQTNTRHALIPAPPVQVAVGIPADLIRRRPDVRNAEFAAASQSARIGIARANLFPALSLSGSFGFVSSNATGNSLGDMFQWGSHFYRFGPAVQWNLFNYGQITNQVRQQDAAFQAALLSYRNLVLKAQKEVEDSLIAFLKTQEAAELFAESTAAAQRSLNLATIQYREGIADFTTVLTAEQSLLSQQDNLVTTLGEISSNLVGVYRTLGGGWQIREGKEFVPEPIRTAMARRTNWGTLLDPLSTPTRQPDSLIRAPDW